jgi:hypothetical protein
MAKPKRIYDVGISIHALAPASTLYDYGYIDEVLGTRKTTKLAFMLEHDDIVCDYDWSR